MRKWSSFVAVIVIACVCLTGCALFKPDQSGNCPTITVEGAKLLAGAGAAVALEKGAPVVILNTVAVNLDSVADSNQITSETLAQAFAPLGAFGPYLASAASLIQTAYQAAISQGLDANVCIRPIAKSFAAGIRGAIANQGAAPAVKLQRLQH